MDYLLNSEENMSSTNTNDLELILEIIVKEVATVFGNGLFTIDYVDLNEKGLSTVNNFENYLQIINPGIELHCKLAVYKSDQIARVHFFKVMPSADLDFGDGDFAAANAQLFKEHRKVIEDLINETNKYDTLKFTRDDWPAIDALKKCLESREELKFDIDFGGAYQESLVTLPPSSCRINLETEKTVTGSIRYFDKKSQNLVLYKTDQSQGELQLHVKNFEDCQKIRQADANDSILTVAYYATIDAARPSLNLHRGDLKEIIKIRPGQSAF